MPHKTDHWRNILNKNRPKLTILVCLCFLALAGLACNSTSSEQTPVANAQNAAPASNAAAASTSTGAMKDISGNYTVSGQNEGGGGEYGGDLNVTKRDDVYQFSWKSGTNQYDGVGVQAGNSVAASFIEGTDGKGCGVVLYQIGANGNLDGKAGYWGVNQAETEKATRTGGSDLEGTYDVSGSNTGGKTYTGKLNVKKEGAGYRFAWTTGENFNGFGIRGADMVAVGLGGSNCGFVGYDIKPDGTLDGKWGSQGTTSVGTEIAKKK